MCRIIPNQASYVACWPFRSIREAAQVSRHWGQSAPRTIEASRASSAGSQTRELERNTGCRKPTLASAARRWTTAREIRTIVQSNILAACELAARERHLLEAHGSRRRAVRLICATSTSSSIQGSCHSNTGPKPRPRHHIVQLRRADELWYTAQTCHPTCLNWAQFYSGSTLANRPDFSYPGRGGVSAERPKILGLA
jgi:hypothetical protein